ncbi:hypothetical protein AMECASPLE_015967 [Ameca splendens]|uniref:Uncharacterized protein n=1 Tax=Ameca splendens TaxID=208324 RepID=A0ABV0ZXU4_9TELE
METVSYPAACPISTLCSPLTGGTAKHGALSIYVVRSENILVPILHASTGTHPFFRPSQTDAAFQVWHDSSWVLGNDQFIDGTLASFETLQQSKILPRTHSSEVSKDEG